MAQVELWSYPDTNNHIYLPEAEKVDMYGVSVVKYQDSFRCFEQSLLTIEGRECTDSYLKHHRYLVMATS